ncbi:MAG: hydrogenase maturation protease [Deinococcales bacterium]
MTRVVVAGLGNDLRRDDGVGPAVMLRVARSAGPGVTVVVNAGEPADLLEAWRHADVAIVVDAMDAGLEPGATRRIEAGATDGQGALADAAPFPGSASSHLLPLSSVVELARALDAMPGRLLIFGVQGAAFGYGEGLTPEVERAVERVAAEILDEVGAAFAP